MWVYLLPGSLPVADGLQAGKTPSQQHKGLGQVKANLLVEREGCPNLQQASLTERVQEHCMRAQATRLNLMLISAPDMRILVLRIKPKNATTPGRKDTFAVTLRTITYLPSRS